MVNGKVQAKDKNSIYTFEKKYLFTKNNYYCGNKSLEKMRTRQAVEI